MFTLPAEMTIQHLETLESAFNQLVHDDDQVILDGSQIVKVDTAGIQILCALQKSLQLTDKSIQWSGTSAVLQNISDTIGAAQFLGIPKNT